MNEFILKSVLFCSLLAMSIVLVGCDDEYHRGYNAGYEEGYGKGYEEGKSDGYKSGTAVFVKHSFIPSLGMSITVLLFCAAVYFLYRYWREPAKRYIVKKQMISKN